MTINGDNEERINAGAAEESHMLVAQPRLGKGGLIALITVLGTAAPLSTDMYMPALPTMAEEFGVTVALCNSTMYLFFLFMAIGILIWGPISDRRGRKPILITILAIYMLSSLGCMLAPTFGTLIVARSCQAIGAGGMISLSLALVKDGFAGHIRDTVLAIVQSMGTLAPVASPVIGAAILRVASWHTVFLVLAFVSGACLVVGLLMAETHPKEMRTEGGLLDSMKRLVVVGRNISFTPYCLITGIFQAPFMAYIGVASYTYITMFGLSETHFSFYFAVNAGISAIGPVLFVKIGDRFDPKTTMRAAYVIGGICAAAMLLVGDTAPYIFSLCFIPFMVLTNYLRPHVTGILLRQQKGDTGSASSLLNFVFTGTGAIGMIVGSMNWSNFVTGLGVTMLGGFALSFLGWIFMNRSRRIRTFDVV